LARHDRGTRQFLPGGLLINGTEILTRALGTGTDITKIARKITMRTGRHAL
jgi:hypothetical protein